MSKFVKIILILIAAGLGLFLLAQLVPYGRNHANPPVVQEPTWPSTEVRALAVRACFDCHSNETKWPWYTNVAPMSWLVQKDVDEGRSKLNFSEWGRGEQEFEEAAETVREGEMPPLVYLPLHPEASLSEAEKSTLITGLTAMGGGEGRGGNEGEDD
jgi:hypothetical protein